MKTPNFVIEFKSAGTNSGGTSPWHTAFGMLLIFIFNLNQKIPHSLCAIAAAAVIESCAIQFSFSSEPCQINVVPKMRSIENATLIIAKHYALFRFKRVQHPL